GAGPPESGKVPLGASLRLRSGCVKLDWAAGGETIIEGPAFIELASRRELFLGHGNVAANVPGGGFVVRTPSGVMTDLGTRFGVAVQPDGTTQVDVFEGAVQAVVHSSAAAPMTNGPTTGPTAQPLMLSAGKAASLAGGTVTLDQGGAMPQRFITRLSSDVSQLDVVDLVCGGDGSTHRRGEALDPVTGKYGELKPVGARSAEKSFHRIAGLPVIDGVFVPNGSRGPTLIDSARDLFSFPATTGIIVNHIWTGGAIPWFHSPAIRTDIAGVDYSQLPHGILCIHSNGGLTFNLANIRRLYPGRSLARFHCTVGNSYVNGTLNETGFNPRADVYVIVDGKVRQERRQFTNQDGVFTIDVPLQKTDRFMSLATTDGGDDINDDWVLWLDPQIQLGN
ncbi:MAG TPA: FecR domain-containing protein, partial [Tepidisphaeraceae bacterium]|nr:FecR domain-containing protein [Tepidisphaeraceae bacterium]